MIIPLWSRPFQLHTLMKRVTSGPYNYTLLKRVTSSPYTCNLMKRVSSGPYNYTLMDHMWIENRLFQVHIIIPFRSGYMQVHIIIPSLSACIFFYVCIGLSACLYVYFFYFSACVSFLSVVIETSYLSICRSVARGFQQSLPFDLYWVQFKHSRTLLSLSLCFSFYVCG